MADYEQQCHLEMQWKISWYLGDEDWWSDIKKEVAVVAVNTSAPPLSAVKVVFNKYLPDNSAGIPGCDPS